ncbi:hypothetical protein GCK72_003154 [Caenorhabditis remanei]|uniref:F-box domain-containing protein n=1 Tax=Caenorhabditis remanei TaxID=31234 RepID=A0A6A5HTQ2_CAERE|nr:hypothetical protein GCK72_003154 [Caenorhabditis remanei]KAF1771328.1 hypothetical protein GCK72_003154 [Caenorhabditis remanei]
MSSPFPLLRLPQLVLCEVFKSLSIGEKIMLSFCSKKVSIQINIAQFYSQKVQMCLDMSNQRIDIFSEDSRDLFQIAIDFNRKINNPRIQSFSIGRYTVPTSKNINTYWKNHQEGFLTVTQHLLKMFHCTISADISYNNFDLYPSTISKLFDLQAKFKTLSILLNGSQHQTLLLNQISNKFGLFEDLRIVSVANPQFIQVFNSWPHEINISSSAWFPLNYLLACTSSIITLGWSQLENKDLDVILRKWKTGGFPNLEYLYVESQSIKNNGTTILGMNSRELSGKVIQTDDGSKKATIKLGTRSIEMSVTPH